MQHLVEKIIKTWGHAKFHVHTKDDKYNDSCCNSKVLMIILILWEYGSPHLEVAVMTYNIVYFPTDKLWKHWQPIRIYLTLKWLELLKWLMTFWIMGVILHQQAQLMAVLTQTLASKLGSNWLVKFFLAWVFFFSSSDSVTSGLGVMTSASPPISPFSAVFDRQTGMTRNDSVDLSLSLGILIIIRLCSLTVTMSFWKLLRNN